MNSHQTVPTDNPIDPWLRYLRRQHKPEVAQSDDSAPKTPQDMLSVTSMPTAIQISGGSSNLETPPSNDFGGAAEVINHPLSPVQETGHDIVQSSNMSVSLESLTSQTLNPNVWPVQEYEDVPHGLWLTAADVENIRHFIQDFTVRALIPYVEQLVVALNDSITNKKGVSRSLLSATKRWFATNKPGVNTAQNAVVYTVESTELQTRKLGDLYFMFGHYNLAFQAYHQAKRDFNADSAWQYYAGALEMAALSAFMQAASNKKTYDYMEEAIVTYLNICKMPQFATRATILSLEVLKSVKLYADAAKQLLRMSNEDSDLRSGVLLEQAAYCFLHTTPPSYRKYAFHSVLAGHRFAKSGQRKHAFRCYKQAYQIFINRGWNLAEDHIQYTIGKQAINLKKLDEATTALAHLLRPSSLQSAQQQSAFLKEYITTQKSLLSQSDASKLLDISLPRIVQNSVRVLVTSQPPLSSPMYQPATNININSVFPEEQKWTKIEEMLVQFATKTPIMIFKPTRALFTNEAPTADSPLAIHGEPIEISFVLENTIKPAITFEDVCLLWEFEKEGGERFTNQDLYKMELSDEERRRLETIVASTPIKLIQFNELERKTLCIKMTPCFEGALKIIGVVGKIALPNESTSLWGKINFEQATIKSKDGAKNKPPQLDRKLDIFVLPPAPALHVSFSNIPGEVLAGEVLQIGMQMANAGASPLGDIYVAIESPRWLLVNPLETDELPLSLQKGVCRGRLEGIGNNFSLSRRY
jgi:trafficking protein particle complex subunit 8